MKSDLESELNEVKKLSERLGERLDVVKKEQRVRELQDIISQEDTWKDREKAEGYSKELGSLNATIRRWQDIGQEMQDLIGLYEMSKDDHRALAEIENSMYALKRKIEAFEKEMYLTGRYDAGNTALTVTAGAGGQDAEDWAAMLCEMYQGYAARRGWDVLILDESFGEGAKTGRTPIKHMTMEIKGAYAYGLLKKESGVHRLVRISPFSAKQLRHTSFAAIEVLPDISAVDENSIELRPEDVRMEMARSSGPGGQNVNKRETAVRIVHLPTGLAASSQVERLQPRNRDRALKLLKAKIFHLMQQNQAKEIKELRGEKTKIEWANQIRSYVLHPYKLVKDHRTDYESHNPDAVLSGELDNFIEAELAEGR